MKTRFNGDKNQIELQKNYSIFLYRIFSELVANIIKHAKANLIELNVKKGKNFYYITVQDDGVGFNTKLKNKATEKGGFGLLSITERLDSIKGRLLIESEIGKGTKATVVIPY
jgi:signal transduction histidine kinase